MQVRRAVSTQQEAHIRSCRQGHEEYLEGSTAAGQHCCKAALQEHRVQCVWWAAGGHRTEWAAPA